MVPVCAGLRQGCRWLTSLLPSLPRFSGEGAAQGLDTQAMTSSRLWKLKGSPRRPAGEEEGVWTVLCC